MQNLLNLQTQLSLEIYHLAIETFSSLLQKKNTKNGEKIAF